MKEATQSKPEQLSEEQVAGYLRTHPDFFLSHDNLLLDLNLPHDSGAAISLVERQVNLLRERNIDMRHRLNRLLENARDNDRLFDKTRRLILRLIEADTIDALIEALNDSLLANFDCDAFNLIVFAGNDQALPMSQASLEQAKRRINRILRNQRPTCGQLNEEELAFLFPEQCNRVVSAAVAPLQGIEVLGVLALGSFDESHFNNAMGTLFISYISEVLARVLPPLLEAERKAVAEFKPARSSVTALTD